MARGSQADIEANTKRTCEMYERMLAAGEDKTVVIGELAAMAGVQRSAIFRRLQRGGVIPRTQTQMPRAANDPAPRLTSLQKLAVAPLPEFRDPCPRCGIRADVGCKHLHPNGYFV